MKMYIIYQGMKTIGFKLTCMSQYDRYETWCKY